MFDRSRRYEIGSITQDTKGYIRIKKQDGTWITQHRQTAIEKGDALGRTGELEEGEKVFHIDNERFADNGPKNIIRIKQNTRPFRLAHSRVLWRPATGKAQAMSQTKALLQAAWDGVNRRTKNLPISARKDRRKIAA